MRHRMISRTVLVALLLAFVSFAGEALAQGAVLPLPPADQQKLAEHLGAGVVGAALPSERISEASRYFPLSEKTFVFHVTSGPNAGNTQNLVLKKARRPGGAPS